MPRPTPRDAPAGSYRATEKLIAIGASTGGVEALITVLSGFPADCPPTVITQHMPANFTRSFADRLDRMCKPTVSEAVDRAVLSRGHVYIAPGGQYHLEVHRRGDGVPKAGCGQRAGQRPPPLRRRADRRRWRRRRDAMRSA